MTKFTTLDGFRAMAKDGGGQGQAIALGFHACVKSVDEAKREVLYTVSTDRNDRGNDRVFSKGWDLEAYKANPVVLFAHDMHAPPIGRSIDIGIVDMALKSVCHFAEVEVYPFADTVFKLVKGGYLNGVSVGFLPKEWKVSDDKARPFGLDITAQELVEYSVVPVPANPDALIEARAKGIDTGPLREWAEKMLDEGGSVIVPRDLLEQTFKAAKTPRTIRQKYLARAGQPAKTETKTMPKLTRKGLYHVGWLAEILSSLGALQSDLAWEAEWEGDNSPVPGKLADALRSLGETLVGLTNEEVAEALADLGGGDAADDAEPMTMALELASAARKAGVGVAGSLLAATKEHAAGRKIMISTGDAATRDVLAVMKAGKVLSKANLDTLSKALEHHSAGMDCIKSVVDAAADLAEDNPGQDIGPDHDPTEKAATLRRRAKALALKGGPKK